MSSKEKRKSVSIIRSAKSQRPKTTRSNTQRNLPEFSKASKDKLKRKSGSFEKVKPEKLKKKSLTSRKKKRNSYRELPIDRRMDMEKENDNDKEKDIDLTATDSIKSDEIAIGSLRKKDKSDVVSVKRHWFAESGDNRMDSDRLIIQNALKLLGVDSDFQREVIDIIESKSRASGDPPKKLDRVSLLNDIVLVCQREIDDIHRTEVPVARIQSYFRTFHVLQYSTTEVSIEKLAYFDRLLASEQKYVGFMTALRNDYYLPLKSDLTKNLLPGITVETVQRIFFNFEKLLDTSVKIIEKMKQMKEYTPFVFGFGQLFLSIMPSLIDYVAYMSNLQSALESLNRAFLDPYFKQWVIRRKAESELQLFYLSDLLSLPAVQIAKYEDAVEGIFTASIKNYKNKLKKKIKVTVSSLEYDEIYNLKAAREEILQKKALVEECLNLNLSELQDSLIDLDFDIADDNYRRFLRKGSVVWKKTVLDYHLFNDLIILSKNRRVKEYLYLDTLEIVKGNPDLSERSISFEIKKKYLKNSDEKFKRIPVSINQDDVDFYNLLKTYIDASRLLNKVFGVHLNTLSKRPDTEDDVPFVLIDIVNYLSDPSRIISTGIFRKSANSAVIDSVKEKLNNGVSISHIDDADGVDIAANLFKLFLRELPEPVIPFELYQPLMAIPHESKKYKLFEETIKVLKEMPPVNVKVLKFILGFLRRVSKHSGENLMTIDNLSLIISGNIIRPRIETPETTLNYGRSNIIFEILITNYRDFVKNFEDVPEEKEEEGDVSYIISTSELDEPLKIYYKPKDEERAIGPMLDLSKRSNQIKQDILKDQKMDKAESGDVEQVPKELSEKAQNKEKETPEKAPKEKKPVVVESLEPKKVVKKKRRSTSQTPKKRGSKTSRSFVLYDSNKKAALADRDGDGAISLSPLLGLRKTSEKANQPKPTTHHVEEDAEDLYILKTLRTRRKTAVLIEETYIQ